MSLKDPYKPGGMFEGASHFIFANAKHLRKNLTEPERILWNYLKKGINGFKIRRQHPIGLYIADFYCHKAKLMIEVDASIHTKTDINKADISRQNELEQMGYTIIRFTNQQAITKSEEVIKNIGEKISYLINLQKQSTP